jgi:hydroxylamine reductase
MFCFQCQETAKNAGCTNRGVCGKEARVADLQDVLVYNLKGLALIARRVRASGGSVGDTGTFIMKGLFATITNANFDAARIKALIFDTVGRKRALAPAGAKLAAIEAWQGSTDDDFAGCSATAAVTAEANADVRSLKELVIYALKGLCAYGEHAHVLGYVDKDLDGEVIEILAATNDSLALDQLLGLVERCGKACVAAMALLDRANTTTYGHPQVTKVNIGVGPRPGILVSGHDLRDLADLLEQTKGTGVDVYTHGEMLPAHAYPAFRKYKNFVGNYGGSWWKQGEEFDSFNGPILMTTNCIVPVRDGYKDRIFTSGSTGYPGVPHIADRSGDKAKDFSGIIALAKKCQAPRAIESGEIVAGFAHDQVEKLADKVVAAIKAGKLRKFVVMGGCDGRARSREYFTDLAKTLPRDMVILTSGCAKFRYNKLALGDIDGIPRVLDAGQCNDSYSIAVTALKLKEIFGAADVNDLPIDFAIAWYEQKAVCVLVALLVLGFKGVRIGPTLPAFVSENVKRVLIEKFNLKATADVQADLKAIAGA